MVTALDIIGNDRSLQEHWLKRLVAIIIDSIIFSVIGSVLALLTVEMGFDLPYLWELFWPGISGTLLFVYSTVMEASSGGATLGKRILDLRVISLTGDMDIGKAAMRNVSKVYGLFLMLDWLIGFVTEGDPKQKWLDRVAGTTVIITTALTDQEQHIYQTQQSKYAPPPQEPYQPTRHQQVYQYPPATPVQAPAQSQNAHTAPAAGEEAACLSCGGRMTETGGGRMKCIRCGKIQ